MITTASFSILKSNAMHTLATSGLTFVSAVIGGYDKRAGHETSNIFRRQKVSTWIS